MWWGWVTDFGLPEIPGTRFVEGSGMPVNTVPPNDFSYWEMVNGLVQQEPAGAGEPEMMGLLAAVGIIKGKPFKPDGRTRKIIEDAVVAGNATARTISFAPRPEEGFAYYPGWGSPLNRSCAGQRPATRVGVAGAGSGPDVRVL